MKKVIIYGIGARFNYFFIYNTYLLKRLCDKYMMITAIADGNAANKGKVICFNGEKYSVKTKDELKQEEYDVLLITSSKYYNEIKSSLVSDGHDSGKIFLVEDMLKRDINKACHIDLFKDKSGLEVGGPSDMFSGIYEKCYACDGVNFSNDTVWWKAESNAEYLWGDKSLGKTYIADAVDMHMIPKGKYDFLLSSNNLEHIANPLKALKEFKRVVKAGGYIVIAVPIKECTFDHNRDFTTFEHLLNDYRNEIGEDDLSHMPEILEKHDYEMDVQCGGRDAFIERAYKNIENRCLHHHVFNESCLKGMVEWVGLQIVDFHAVMDNFIIIGMVKNE